MTLRHYRDFAYEYHIVARNKKAAIFVRCTDQEATRIRRVAKLERRTVSDFILHAVKNRIDQREKLLRESQNSAANPTGRAHTAAP